jgi:hypothetical protein
LGVNLSTSRFSQSRKETLLGPYDTEFVFLAHADRVASLRRSAARGMRREPRRLRRRLAGWLIAAGLRLASEPTPRTRAA